MTKSIWITGTGTATCAGSTPENLWREAVEERTGIEGGLGHISNSVLSAMCNQAKASPFYPQLKSLLENLPKSKPILIAFFALTEAMRNAGWKELNEDDGFIFATTTGQISSWDRILIQFLKKQTSQKEFEEEFKHQPLGSLLNILCHMLNFNGKSTLITSACSASSQAIALGSLWLKQGRVKRCIVGGSETLCNLTMQGFRSLQLLSQEPTTPFDLNRKGINLSEGAGFLCLETIPRNCSPLAKISGYGWSTDAYHMTSPHPEGQGCLQAMESALHKAKLQPNDINWVHAHGTGSHHNDFSEGKAILRLFEKGELPWVSSTKWVHGHSLGASGAIESILCIQAIQNRMILKTGGLKNPDPDIPLKHPLQNTPLKINHILKNTLGFGGTNTAIVLSRPDVDAL